MEVLLMINFHLKIEVTYCNGGPMFFSIIRLKPRPCKHSDLF